MDAMRARAAMEMEGPVSMSTFGSLDDTWKRGCLILSYLRYRRRVGFLSYLTIDKIGSMKLQPKPLRV